MGFKRIGCVCLIVCGLAWAAKVLTTKMDNADELRTFYELDKAYEPSASLNDIKIAVLDNGFAGYGEDETHYLPEDTILKDSWGEGRNPLVEKESHGRKMAQVAWAMTGMSETNHPQFFLLNANGPTNFRDAIDFFKKEKEKDKDKVHVMLISMNFESMGNFDGRGFANRWVNEATAAGIITIVAAGNYYGSVFNGPVQTSDIVDTRDKDRTLVTFGKGKKAKDYLEFVSRISEDKGEKRIEHTMDITLSWNDFTEDMNDSTDRDLDLYLEDENNTILEKSQYKQEKGEGKKSNWAREKIQWTGYLKKDRKYKIRVSAKNGSAFNAASDKLRVTINSGRDANGALDAIDFKDASYSDEIMVLADNLSVITVGDRSPFCSSSSIIGGRAKPDLYLPRSDVRFDVGAEPPSTSYAAAIFAGIAINLLAKEPLATREDLLKSVGRNAPAVERAFPLVKAREYFEHIMKEFESRLKKETVRVVVRNGQQMLLVVDKIPTDLLTLIDGENQQKISEKVGDYDYYLVARNVGGGVKVSAKIRGAQDSYPWMARNENPSAFVQVITEEAYKKVQEKDKRFDMKRVWKTPTPDELRQALR